MMLSSTRSDTPSRCSNHLTTGSNTCVSTHGRWRLNQSGPKQLIARASKCNIICSSGTLKRQWQSAWWRAQVPASSAEAPALDGPPEAPARLGSRRCPCADTAAWTRSPAPAASAAEATFVVNTLLRNTLRHASHGQSDNAARSSTRATVMQAQQRTSSMAWDARDMSGIVKGRIVLASCTTYDGGAPLGNRLFRCWPQAMPF